MFCWKHFLNFFALFFLGCTLFLSNMAKSYNALDFQYIPPFIGDSSNPLVMINLSVENTQQAEAFTDGEQYYKQGTYCPPIRVKHKYGFCFSSAESYLGYFDEKKCYGYKKNNGSDYRYSKGAAAYRSRTFFQRATSPERNQNQSGDYFFPLDTGGSNGACPAGSFSGNFMNWASMTALDTFRFATTGGARIVDTAGSNAQTLLTRTHRYDDWIFVDKYIDVAGIDFQGLNYFPNDPSAITPFQGVQALKISSQFVSNTNVLNGGISNYRNKWSGNRIRFYEASKNANGSYKTGKLLAELNVIVEVCNPQVGLEDNCIEYSDGAQTWYKPEGILQENALKMRFALSSYLALNGNAVSGGVLRTNAKYIGQLKPAALGQRKTGGLESNPNAETNLRGQFVLDPDRKANAAEKISNSGVINYINSFGLGSRGYKRNDPVAELYYEGLRYIKNLGPTPEYYQPALSALNTKDLFPVMVQWDDPVLDACQRNYMVTIGDQFPWADNNLPGMAVPPSNPDREINTLSLTNEVGTLENYFPGNLGVMSRGREGNGWHLAGLAYYAANQDIRSSNDLLGKQTVTSYFVDTQEWKSNAPQQENNPLWLAAKYGGFDFGSGLLNPNEGEWSDENGDPKTYTSASQPENLIQGLREAFNEMGERINSGTSAGVVSYDNGDLNVILQGLFIPTYTQGESSVQWAGVLRSFYRDENNNIREDSGDTLGVLDQNDPAIKFYLKGSGARKQALASRYRVDTQGRVATAPYETDIDVQDIRGFWNSRDELAKLTNLTTQRNFSNLISPASGRHIVVGIDNNIDGIVSGGEVQPFVANTFESQLKPNQNEHELLGIDASEPSSVEGLINFVRGDTSDNRTRNRSVDFDGVPGNEPWILGDIVSSSPTIVARPTFDERYDLIYNDHTFNAFWTATKHRRHVAYVGGNDGMLHAFNVGFYDQEAQRYVKTSSKGLAHPLGSELWAYVPYNLLPHLQWLAQPNYPHVSYVDGIPQVFNARIFPNDTHHPNGWGTILVVGMRFGGGKISLPSADGESNRIFQSAYLIFDVTNPELEPQLLAEITREDLGFTTSRPTLVKSGNAQKWYLVMGSGPTDSSGYLPNKGLQFGQSDQSARLFAFNLLDKTWQTFSDGKDYLEIPGAENGFVGDLVSVDWDRDYHDDVVYFGTVTGTVGSPGGALMRLKLGSSTQLISSASVNTLITGVNQPFSGRPHVKRLAFEASQRQSASDERWIFTGGGRFYVSEDNLSRNSQLNKYLGVKEPSTVNQNDRVFSYSSAVSINDLVEVTQLKLDSQNTPDSDNPAVTSVNGLSPVLLGGKPVSSYSELVDITDQKGGWHYAFQHPASRHVGVSDGRYNHDFNSYSVSFTEYVPTGNACDPYGDSYLHSIDARTGLPSLDIKPPVANPRNSNILKNFPDDPRSDFLTWGLVRDIVIVEDKITVQGGLGDLDGLDLQSNLPPDQGRSSWREILIDW